MKKLLVPGLVLLAHGVASATPYISASAGITHSNIDTLGDPADKSGVGFKLIGGYKFTGCFAVEAGFFDRGKVDVRDADPSDTFETELKTTAFGAGVAYHHKLSEKWSFSARAGLASVRVKVTVTEDGWSASDSYDHVEPYGGLDLSHHFTPKFSVNVGWELMKARYKNDFAETKFNVSTFSAGATWHF
jgi:hypothetical protein